jgi:hypothetical protein
MELRIPAGDMCQEWDCLIDLLEQDKAKDMEMLVADCGWREVQAAEVSEMGFAELVDWSLAETGILPAMRLILNEHLGN